MIDSNANGALDPSLFILSFPKGTRVLQIPKGGRLRNGKNFIQIDDKGSLRPIEK